MNPVKLRLFWNEAAGWYEDVYENPVADKFGNPIPQEVTARAPQPSETEAGDHSEPDPDLQAG